MTFPSNMQLASEPGIWKILLASGEEVQVLTHGYATVGSETIFVLLMEGEPCFEVPVLRIPTKAVKEIYD